MQLSFSELKDLVFNAGLGMNLPAGSCEDLAFAVASLESLNVHGSNEFLHAIACKNDLIRDFVIKKNEVEVDIGRTLFEGIYAVDLFIAEKVNKIIFCEFDCPMLLVGLGCNYYNANFNVCYSDKIIGSINSGKIFWDNDFKLRNCSITMTRSDTAIMRHSKKKDRLNLSQSTFKKLNKLATKMLVPESEYSRATGAGAGIIDND